MISLYKYRTLHAVLLLVLSSSLTLGCSSRPKIHLAERANFSIEKPVESLPLANLPIDESTLFHLTQEQQADFLSYYYAKLDKGEEGHKVIYSYLVSRLSNFNYYSETFKASESLKIEEGNCMTLAILTTALAKLVNIDFTFRLMISEPIYDKQGKFITTARHVNTRLFAPTLEIEKEQSEEKQDEDELPLGESRDSILVDYFPSGDALKGLYIDYDQFISLYFENAAVEQLIKGNSELAYFYSYQAWQKKKVSISALNLLAVTSRKLNKLNQAEQIYLHILDKEPFNLHALKNYGVLLTQQGRREDYREIQQKLINADDQNPFLLIEEAKNSYLHGNLELALSFYEKAIKRAPYLVQPYINAYDILMFQEKEKQANLLLAEGLKWVYQPEYRMNIKEKMYNNYSAQLKTQ